jgi:signal transduction histidine kinase/ligand-binding sensor domain-containing protein/DNA-binding response OmpR family regulator
MCKWLLLLVISIPWRLPGQDFLTQYRTYTVTDGLPHHSLNYVLQDSDGFIWIAGLNGIARFDGYQFKTYHPAYILDSLTPPRDFPILYEGTQGQLWLGYALAKHKLFRYDQQRDTFLLFDTNPIDQAIRGLWQDREDELFVASGAEGLWRFDLTASSDTIPYQKYRTDSQDSTSLPTDYMATGMWRDPKGQLWILTESGLSCMPAGEEHFKTYTWSEVPEENEGLHFWPDTLRKCFWIGTFVGLVRFNWEEASYERFPLFSAEDSAKPLPISSPVVDVEGRVWVSVGLFPKAKIHLFTPENGQFEIVVTEQSGTREEVAGANRLAIDRNGGVWSAGYNRGLQRLQQQQSNVLRLSLAPDKSISGVRFDDQGITAMVEDRSGNIWFATQQQGVWKWEPTARRLLQVELPLPAQPAINKLLLSEEEHYLWAFTQARIMRLSTADLSWQAVDPFPGKPDYASYKSAIAWQDKLLGSCFYQGFYQLDLEEPANQQRYLPEQVGTTEIWGDLPVAEIICITADNNRQSLWLGTSYLGLYEWQVEEKKVVNHLKQTQVQQILATHDGLLWLSTTRGLQVYDPQAKMLLPTPSWPNQRLNFVMGMVADKKGLLWVADEQGILAIDGNTREIVHDFQASEWLAKGQEWYGGNTSCLHTQEGTLLFANSNGLFIIHPEEIYYDTVPPQICLDELWVGKNKQALPTSPAVLVKLGYQENDLTFRVAVLHYKLPVKNQLVYKLRNFDATWRTLAPDQSLEYPNLPPGDYELLAYGINSDGYAGTEQSILSFQIAPPWYASMPALLIYALLFLGGVYGVFRFLLWRRTQEAEQRYWQELDAAKSTLFTNISHEFRTPLTLILGEASSLKEKLNGQAGTPIDRIRRSGQRLLWLVNQLLELARADSGFLRLQLQQSDVVAFLRQHLHAFHSLAELKGIELRFVTQVPTLMMDFDPERLQHVISNLLHNAIKFSEEGGEVTMALAVDDEEAPAQFFCRVIDQGVGLAPGAIPRIFDRFYRVDAHTGGSGIGLALTRELVLLMDGEITVESEWSKGSTFQISLPIRKAAPPGKGDWNMDHLAIADSAATVFAETKSSKLRLPPLLLIEDNEDLRAFLQTCLSEHYQLTLARDGEEGLDLAFDQDFDLIISDVMMPKLDGFTVCQTLKEDLSTSHIPLILLTARVDKMSRLEGLSRGADAYLGKPFDPNELRLLCQQLLRQRQRLRDYYLQMIRTGQLSDQVLSAEEQTEMAFIVEVRQQVMLHLGEEYFGVEELAVTLNISRSHLHRKLQQMLGLSTSRFIRSIRMSEAQKMMVDLSFSISQIAYAVGYSDPDYFSKTFKEEHGVSPTVYRKQFLQGEEGKK